MTATNQETAERTAPPEANPAPTAPETLRRLKEAVQAGTPWRRALLEAIGLWTQPQEDFQGRTYRYMIQGEAFDWLVLAERLCSELDGLIPPEEKESLLFGGRLPETSPPELFRDLLGANKYRAYLNYWYGVVVEEALQLSAEEDVRKRHIARGYADTEELVEYAFMHLYSAPRSDLLDEFRQEAGIPKRRGLSLTDVKGFTYWLHKRRISQWDPARVASDTRKGIRKLRLLEQTALTSDQPPPARSGDQPPPAGSGDQPPPAGSGDQPPPAGSGDQPPPARSGDQPPPAGSGDQPPPAAQTSEGPPTPAHPRPRPRHSRAGGNPTPRSS